MQITRDLYHEYRTVHGATRKGHPGLSPPCLQEDQTNPFSSVLEWEIVPPQAWEGFLKWLPCLTRFSPCHQCGEAWLSTSPGTIVTCFHVGRFQEADVLTSRGKKGLFLIDGTLACVTELQRCEARLGGQHQKLLTGAE